jgi:hypothetical protein
MGEFHKVQVGDLTISPIDWEMSPDLSFGTFESWGGRERVRNNDERVYYFFVDNWGEVPKLCLMERAVKHARIMAEIKAPREIIEKCVASQGASSTFEKSYAINDQIKAWLIDNVLNDGDARLVVPRSEKVIKEDMGPRLPDAPETGFHIDRVVLPHDPAFISEGELGSLVREYGFFEAQYNAEGSFENTFVASESDQVVTDLRTSLMWQRYGIDIGSIRHIQREVERYNREKLAGFSDWRLPTMQEALSIMEKERNSKGVHLHPCFSREQPFVFVAAQRKPGGYWFVDYKQGRAFWASGTIPGGFGRLVRTVS